MRNCSNDSLEADAEIDPGQTRMYEPWLDGINLSLASQRCGFDDPEPKFCEIVKAERLILYGRTGNTERGRIIASDIERVDIHQSKVVAGGVEFADVTAWPVLRSPSRVDLVTNSSLAEVFERYLLNDPEVAALSPSAIAAKPELARVFEEGWYTPYGIREWRVDLEFSLLGGFERGALIGFLDDTGPPAVIDAIDALKSRFAAFVIMFRSGEIEAYGLPHRKTYPPTIMRSLWSHKDSLLDLRNGDFYFDNPKADNLRTENQTKLWTAIMLRRGDSAPNVEEPAHANSDVRSAFHVKPLDDADTRLKRNEPSQGSVTAKKPPPRQESIAMAIAALWPNGIPKGLPVQKRDQRIIDWQKSAGLAVVDPKTINRFVKNHSVAN